MLLNRLPDFEDGSQPGPVGVRQSGPCPLRVNSLKITGAPGIAPAQHQKARQAPLIGDGLEYDGPKRRHRLPIRVRQEREPWQPFQLVPASCHWVGNQMAYQRAILGELHPREVIRWISSSRLDVVHLTLRVTEQQGQFGPGQEFVESIQKHLRGCRWLEETQGRPGRGEAVQIYCTFPEGSPYNSLDNQSAPHSIPSLWLSGMGFRPRHNWKKLKGHYFLQEEIPF